MLRPVIQVRVLLEKKDNPRAPHARRPETIFVTLTGTFHEDSREHNRPGGHSHRHAILHEPRNLPGETLQPQERHVELRVRKASVKQVYSSEHLKPLLVRVKPTTSCYVGLLVAFETLAHIPWEADLEMHNL